ncbi:hypothetical protein CBR_g27921 [Chara braunii]|uniref:Reverse transcriptase domain-containing protein n=1 Tax=Chara braunii TaxID=69332 RepID=A0A388L8R4_CHABU|nr:hypothetical protein CBR_g27921 [Chara braunii]|eukprot:GBG78695.1 hypothetical protein CBR_g27921 [Chara braunii]
MVGTRIGKETNFYTPEQQAKMAAIVKENRERKEREKQAKLKAIADERATKMKEVEEEMKKNEKAAEEEAAAEEQKERMGIESGEGSSGGTMTRETDTGLEKKISEWVANLWLGEEEEAESYATEDERAALASELATMTDPMERREREEQKLAWKLRKKREKKRRREEVSRMAAEVAKVQACRQEMMAQPTDKAKWDKVLGYLEVLSKAWIEERQASWSQDVALSAMRLGFRDYAREIVIHIGGEVKQLRENVGKFCEGAIQGAKAVAAIEGEARPRKDSVKLEFRDAYGGKKEENFDNWEASVNIVYLDDILVFSKTLQEHQGHLRQVLEKLREANFKINAKKCEWAKTQVLYLGRVLDGDGIKPEDSKIAAIRDWPTPRTLTELRSFLGLANYYRKFVRNFSTIAAPLRRLLKKEAIWQWDKYCTSALKKLKRALIEYPGLKVADPSLPFVVTTDASQYGIGAEEQYEFSRSQDMAVRSMRMGFRDFARKLVGAVGAEVNHRLEKTERFCVGAIEGVKATAPKEEEARPRREPVEVKFPDSYSGKREENFDNWEANVKTYVHLQQVSPDQHVLIAIHALKDEAASFARSLVRSANCNDDAVAYSLFTSLIGFMKLLRERCVDVARSVKASDRLQTIHSRQWKSARALKGVMDGWVAVPDHGVTAAQLVNLFYKATPESLRGHFFAKSQDPAMTYTQQGSGGL